MKNTEPRRTAKPEMVESLGTASNGGGESGHDFFDQLDMFEKQFAWLKREFDKLRASARSSPGKIFNAKARELRARNSQLCADVIRFME